MGISLVFVLAVVPMVEIYLLLQVGRLIGALDTIALVILSGLFGLWLARRQGGAVLRACQESLRRGELPAEHLIQGFLVFVGGLLLLAPGFLSDFFGLLLLIPSTRKWAASQFRQYLRRNMQKGRFKVYFGHVGPNGVFYEASTFREAERPRPEALGEVIDLESVRKNREGRVDKE